MFETFESRRLLAAAATVSQSGSTLDVNGGADGGVIRVIEHLHSVTVEFNGVPAGAFTGVNAINISGQARNDQVFYTGDTVGAVIHTGGGNDEITITDKGTGSSTGSGDGDADDLVVLDANNTTLIGDGGNDTLYVSDSVDISKSIHLYGMGGADFFNVAGGTNYVYGGGGFDTLITNGVAGVDFQIVYQNSIEATGSV